MPSDAKEQDSRSANSGVSDAGYERSTGPGGLNQGPFLGLNTKSFQESAVVFSAASNYVCSPTLVFGGDREEDACVETGEDEGDWTISVAKWLSVCDSSVASYLVLPTWASGRQLYQLCIFYWGLATLAVVPYQNGLTEADFLGPYT